MESPELIVPFELLEIPDDEIQFDELSKIDTENKIKKPSNLEITPEDLLALSEFLAINGHERISYNEFTGTVSEAIDRCPHLKSLHPRKVIKILTILIEEEKTKTNQVDDELKPKEELIQEEKSIKSLPAKVIEKNIPETDSIKNKAPTKSVELSNNLGQNLAKIPTQLSTADNGSKSFELKSISSEKFERITNSIKATNKNIKADFMKPILKTEDKNIVNEFHSKNLEKKPVNYIIPKEVNLNSLRIESLSESPKQIHTKQTVFSEVFEKSDDKNKLADEFYIKVELNELDKSAEITTATPEIDTNIELIITNPIAEITTAEFEEVSPKIELRKELLDSANELKGELFEYMNYSEQALDSETAEQVNQLLIEVQDMIGGADLLKENVVSELISHPILIIQARAILELLNQQNGPDQVRKYLKLLINTEKILQQADQLHTDDLDKLNFNGTYEHKDYFSTSLRSNKIADQEKFSLHQFIGRLALFSRLAAATS